MNKLSKGRPRNQKYPIDREHTYVPLQPQVSYKKITRPSFPPHKFNIGDLVAYNSKNTSSDNKFNDYFYIKGMQPMNENGGVCYFGYLVLLPPKVSLPITLEKQSFLAGVIESDLGEKLKDISYWVIEHSKTLTLKPSMQQPKQY